MPRLAQPPRPFQAHSHSPHASHTLPAMARVVRDAPGQLWVQPFGIEGRTGTDRWIVVDREGSVAAAIELPASLEVHDVGSDYLLASDTDELGVERVRLWALARQD